VLSLCRGRWMVGLRGTFTLGDKLARVRACRGRAASRRDAGPALPPPPSPTTTGVVHTGERREVAGIKALRGVCNARCGHLVPNEMLLPAFP